MYSLVRLKFRSDTLYKYKKELNIQLSQHAYYLLERIKKRKPVRIYPTLRIGTRKSAPKPSNP